MIYWYENKIERDEQKLKIKQKIIPEDIGGKKYFATKWEVINFCIIEILLGNKFWLKILFQMYSLKIFLTIEKLPPLPSPRANWKN